MIYTSRLQSTEMAFIQPGMRKICDVTLLQDSSNQLLRRLKFLFVIHKTKANSEILACEGRVEDIE